MIIRSICLEDLGPISRFATRFSPDVNAIVGTNGVGKTYLMRILAGLCGNNAATDLLNKLPVGKCVLTIEDSLGDERVFETGGEFDLNEVREWKLKLGKERVNFPITEWGLAFPFGKPNATRARQRAHAFLGTANGSRDQMFTYIRERGSAYYMSGDGYRFAIQLFLRDIDGIPLLVENPGQSLDLVNKRRMVAAMTSERRQLIFTTHDPEFLGTLDLGKSVIDMSSQTKN